MEQSNEHSFLIVIYKHYVTYVCKLHQNYISEENIHSVHINM